MEMQVLAKTRKIGGSIMALIPSEVTKKLNLKENEMVELSVKKAKKSFLGAYKGRLGEFTEEDRADARI